MLNGIHLNRSITNITSKFRLQWPMSPRLTQVDVEELHLSL